MSYPNLIQSLIIEDETTLLYEAIFKTLIEDGEQLALPIPAYGHNTASELLQSDRIIHLVILDLRLPNISGHPAQAGIDHGLDLLTQCAQRNNYPIPALLVISGHLEQADQLDLQAKVAAGFYYGRVLVKSNARELQNAIWDAVHAVKKYVGVGINIRDAGEKSYPTLGSREEDVLRRCVLKIPNCIGVDLKWWSAEYNRARDQYADYSGWTKTLTGRFLFAGDMSSRLSFFKFGPAAGAESVNNSAQMMSHKLPHIKVIDALVSGNRSLLITEKAGNNDRDPISLAEYLSKPSASVLAGIPGVVNDVAKQVYALGDATEERRLMPELMWSGHNDEALQRQWQQLNGNEIVNELGVDADPIALYYELCSDNSEITFKRQAFRHGDLNVSNIAIDIGNEGVSAHIFDASGCGAGPNVRDLATLEISSLLHQPALRNDSLVEQCANLYAATSRHLNFATHSDLVINTFKLISELRSKALQQADEYIYALMVFDNALIQLGGLAFGPSCNKIANPQEAARLAAYAARWLRGVKGINHHAYQLKRDHAQKHALAPQVVPIEPVNI